MRKIIFYVGKVFQLTGLIALPAAMFAAQFNHDEKGSIMIFLSSIAVFALGYFLTQTSPKL